MELMLKETNNFIECHEFIISHEKKGKFDYKIKNIRFFITGEQYEANCNVIKEKRQRLMKKYNAFGSILLVGSESLRNGLHGMNYKLELYIKIIAKSR